MTAIALTPYGAQQSPQWCPPANAGLVPFGMLAAQSGGYQQQNRYPSPLPQAGMELSPQPQGVPLVSLGCACTTKMAFDDIGRGQETLPFDWMCTQIEGIIGFLRSDFQGFFDFTNVEQSYVGPTAFTVYRSATHSWWHDDPTDPICRDKFQRRIQRLLGMQAHNTPILFVRSAATTDEIPMVGTLMQTLQQKFGRESKLLFIIAGQNAPALGPYLVDGMPSLLVYVAPVPNGKGAFSEAVSAAVNWAAGQQLPNCRRTQNAASIPGLIPAYTGLFGMGGLPAFDNIPAHVPRPHRSDGKPNTPTPVPQNTSVQVPMTTLPSPGMLGMSGQHSPAPPYMPRPRFEFMPADEPPPYVPRPRFESSRFENPSQPSAPSTQYIVGTNPSLVGTNTSSVGTPIHRSQSSSSFRNNATPPVPFGMPRTASIEQFAVTRSPSMRQRSSSHNSHRFEASSHRFEAPRLPSPMAAKEDVDPRRQPSPQRQTQGKYQVGDRIEAWSKSGNSWRPGYVESLDGVMVWVHFQTADGGWMKKGIPEMHEQLRHAQNFTDL